MTDLDRELDTLFQAPFAEFVGARNGLATRLKKEGRADESARIRGLAKPTFTAWLINQLYWGARREVDAYLKAADRVRAGERAALEGRKPTGQGDAVSTRAKALEALVARATTRAAEEGTPLSPALTERLRTTLDAIGAYGSEAARHARGRLQEDLDPPGFAALAALGAKAGAPGGRREREPSPPPRLELVRSAAPDPRVSDGRARVTEAQAEAARAQDAASAAADAERRARVAADQARLRLGEAERAVKSAKAEAEAAASALRARQTDAKAAGAAAGVAVKRLDQARNALDRIRNNG